ncbi:MAG: protein-methionine-sulfoxide reductase catalytic subunit MsrP [Devosiaceae bacterium]|nr:protein-methionine-sulfoxide reductase catalytic subunit MsrP [Devosiaceae bacterium]
MLIKSTPNWVIKENQATPEHIYLNRRTLMKGFAGGIAATSIGAIGGAAFAQEGRAAMAAVRNEAYQLDRELTPEDINLKYNNFYEFGSHKRISANAEENLVSRPWQVEIGGLVNNPMTLDVDELIAKVGGLEERLYRLRCVEAWSMTVPWIGFTFAKLASLVEPLGSAKYLRMETFGDPKMGNGIATQPWYPWPYVESITMDEVANELAFLAVGAYGKQVSNSMGAPIRMHLPWKYGFKSIKSIVKFTFVEERPIGFWEEISSAREYGFWANVNPEVPHPRWSQATERVLHTDERVPTLLYNGYAEQVADMYAGIEGQELFR